MVYLFYTTYISVDLAHQVIFHAKVGEGGIMRKITYNFTHHHMTLQTNPYITQRKVTLYKITT